MIPPNRVLAKVVDITKAKAPIPKQIVVDASVLYFVYYPNFRQLAAVGGSQPKHYQTSTYPAWYNTVLKAKTEFFASPVTLAEFIRVCEYAEIEALWISDPNMPDGEEFSPRKCKDARYSYEARLGKIRKDAHSYLLQARKTVKLLPEFANAPDELDLTVTEWLASTGDAADSILVANARYSQVPHVLADDVDILSFGGITVYTANRTALQDAIAAGKLLN
jgi:hypothetical protein